MSSKYAEYLNNIGFMDLNVSDRYNSRICLFFGSPTSITAWDKFLMSMLRSSPYSSLYLVNTLSMALATIPAVTLIMRCLVLQDANLLRLNSLKTVWKKTNSMLLDLVKANTSVQQSLMSTAV